MENLRYIFICIILAMACSVSAQDTTGSEVKIIHSQSIEINRTPDGFLRKLQGDVEVHIDSTQFFSQFLKLYPDDDIHATQDIVIKQGDSLYIYSDTLDYKAASDIATLKSNVVLNDRGRKFFTTQLQYNVDSKVAVYDTFGLLTDDEAQLTSYYGTYDVKTDIAFFRDTVELIHPQVVMKTDSMRYNAALNIAYFLGPTIIKQEDALIYCEGGYYDLRNEVAFLKYNVQYKEGDKLITADSMLYEGTLHKVTLLGDKPHYHTPTVDASANVMVYNDSTKIASLYRNAEVHTEEEDITGDTIHYNTETERYQTAGNFHVLSGSRIIDAENAYFDTLTQSNILYKKVMVQDTAEGYAILGRKVTYRDSLGYIETSQGRPLLYFLSEDKKDTTFLSADSVVSREIYSDSLKSDTGRLVKAFYNVKILSRDFQAICDSLVYNSLDSIINFYYSPVIWSDTMQLKGDTITAHLNKDGMESFFIREHAIIIQHEVAELFNQISGKYIRGYFTENELQYIDFKSNVQSIYYIKDDENAYTGVAEISSASLRIFLNDGEMKVTTYYAQPTGSVLPMTVNHLNMRLPEFDWLIEQRPISIDDLNPVYSNGIIFQLTQMEGKEKQSKIRPQ